jgi:hypothetical protein
MQYRKGVRWQFRDVNISDPNNASRQIKAQARLGQDLFDDVAHQLRQITKDIKRGRMTLNRFRSEVEKIKSSTSFDAESGVSISEWIDAELGPFRCANLITYLQRYEVFQRATDAGVQIVPSVDLLPRFKAMRTNETACLELQSIQSAVEVSNIVTHLAEPNELARVLGKYSNLDVARGGALANILAAELGQNITEHAQATVGWVCTRLVPNEKVRALSNDDPALSNFRTNNLGFLEVIVADNGSGLISNLEPVLRKDSRKSLQP